MGRCVFVLVLLTIPPLSKKHGSIQNTAQYLLNERSVFILQEELVIYIVRRSTHVLHSSGM